jgi:intein/homing endonuclease
MNSYTIIKSIAEELRGLAVEYDVPIFSATQTTRSGFSSSDVEITDTSECIFVDEMVEMRNGFIKKISEVSVGDQIKSQDSYKTVMMVHHKKEKECVKIVTKNGKTIIVSKEHIFPTNEGRKSFNSGLIVGDHLNTNT